LTEGPEHGALLTRTVQVTQRGEGVELYFPPLRMPEVALGLGMFGVIASALPAIAAAAVLPAALADTAGMLAALFIAVFAIPLMSFGIVFIGLAIYTLCNALRVSIDSRTISTSRTVLGFTLSRRQLAHEEIVKIEPEIATRHQSLFSPDPIYQLVAIGSTRDQRLVVAEGLRGAVQMDAVSAIVRKALKLPPVSEEDHELQEPSPSAR
jgi:hypothetical protein